MATKKPIVSPQEKIWRAQDDLRTMRDAHIVQSDPQRMRAVQAEAKKQVAALNKVAAKAPIKPKK